MNCDFQDRAFLAAGRTPQESERRTYMTRLLHADKGEPLKVMRAARAYWNHPIYSRLARASYVAARRRAMRKSA